jgi:hypothetical protein
VDLNTSTEVVRQPPDRPGAEWREDDACLAGFTMPYYVNPLLRRWLRPPPDEPTVRTNLVGLGIVAAVTVFRAVVFYAVTALIRTLPRPCRATA